MRAKRLAVGVLVMAGALGACGGDGRTEEAFVNDVNQVCGRLIEARTAAATEHFPSQTEPPTVDQLQAFYGDFGPMLDDFADDLATIEPTDDHKETYAEFVEAHRQNSATLVKASTDDAVAQHLLETDEAELHAKEDLPVKLGINPEC